MTQAREGGEEEGLTGCKHMWSLNRGARQDDSETERFRTCCRPQAKDITIQDQIRVEVTWNTDTLGDFVLLRSRCAAHVPIWCFTCMLKFHTLL